MDTSPKPPKQSICGVTDCSNSSAYSSSLNGTEMCSFCLSRLIFNKTHKSLKASQSAFKFPKLVKKSPETPPTRILVPIDGSYAVTGLVASLSNLMTGDAGLGKSGLKQLSKQELASLSKNMRKKMEKKMNPKQVKYNIEFVFCFFYFNILVNKSFDTTTLSKLEKFVNDFKAQFPFGKFLFCIPQFCYNPKILTSCHFFDSWIPFISSDISSQCSLFYDPVHLKLHTTALSDVFSLVEQSCFLQAAAKYKCTIIARPDTLDRTAGTIFSRISSLRGHTLSTWNSPFIRITNSNVVLSNTISTPFRNTQQIHPGTDIFLFKPFISLSEKALASFVRIFRFPTVFIPQFSTGLSPGGFDGAHGSSIEHLSQMFISTTSVVSPSTPSTVIQVADKLEFSVGSTFCQFCGDPMPPHSNFPHLDPSIPPTTGAGAGDQQPQQPPETQPQMCPNCITIGSELGII